LASRRAANLLSIVPFLPETIAPALPMRRPFGAVRPAMNTPTGFLTYCFIYSVAISSEFLPIYAITLMASVFESGFNIIIMPKCVIPIT
jgi:hypothetical protein